MHRVCKNRLEPKIPFGSPLAISVELFSLCKEYDEFFHSLVGVGYCVRKLSPGDELELYSPAEVELHQKIANMAFVRAKL